MSNYICSSWNVQIKEKSYKIQFIAIFLLTTYQQVIWIENYKQHLFHAMLKMWILQAGKFSAKDKGTQTQITKKYKKKENNLYWTLILYPFCPDAIVGQLTWSPTWESSATSWCWRLPTSMAIGIGSVGPSPGIRRYKNIKC